MRHCYTFDLHALRKRCISDRNTVHPIMFIWVAWGESHVREALGAACLASAVNSCNERFQYRVFLLGEPVLSRHMCKTCESCNVEIVMDHESPPTNPALYDRMRMERMAAIGGPVAYMDTDVYCFSGFDPARLSRTPIRTFSMGKARFDAVSCHHHGIIDEVLGASSSVFYADEGLGIEDYRRKADFWPYLRYNLGLFYGNGDTEFQRFVECFASSHSLFPSFKWFGTGELIFQALCNSGQAPEHECDWRSGYAPMFPLGKDSMFDIAIETEDGAHISEIQPDPTFNVLHVGHFSRLIYDKESSDGRPMWVLMQEDGSVRLSLSWRPRIIEKDDRQLLRFKRL